MRTAGHAVAHALSGRRLIVASTLVLLVPAALAFTALSYERPQSPPSDAAPSYEVLGQVPDPAARESMDRSRVATRLAAKLSHPALLDPVLTRVVIRPFCRAWR